MTEEYYENGEKCGVCGDDFAEPSPRDHETGGQFANGIVVRRYAPGQVHIPCHHTDDDIK